MMKYKRFIDLALIFYSCLLTTKEVYAEDDLKLRLVSTLFRHGDRIIEKSAEESYPNDPYKDMDFYPDGDGELTIIGKNRAYELGLLLRDKYNSFLGDLYYPPNVYARSTMISRTKMTLQLVLAGLYPPVNIQKWNANISWQPIDMIHDSRFEEDTLLYTLSSPKYSKILYDLLKSRKMQTKEFDDLMKMTSKYTGLNITDFIGLAILYGTLEAEAAMGLSLPEWTQDIFPNGKLTDAMVSTYSVINGYQLTNLNAGVLLNRIIDDMNAVINGTSDRKINLFSAHAINIVGLQHNLNIFDHRVPKYTASIIIELYEKNKKYFVKVLHFLGIPSKILEVTIPGCELLCPFDKFVELSPARNFANQCWHTRPLTAFSPYTVYIFFLVCVAFFPLQK